MKLKIKESLIEEEKDSLKSSLKELEKLKGKWIKSSSIVKSISFLEKYCNKKKKFIEEIEK